MCDHLECHGGKLNIRKVYGAILYDGDKEIPIPPYWEVDYKNPWFPIYNGQTWQDAWNAAETWLREYFKVPASGCSGHVPEAEELCEWCLARDATGTFDVNDVEYWLCESCSAYWRSVPETNEFKVSPPLI